MIDYTEKSSTNSRFGSKFSRQVNMLKCCYSVIGFEKVGTITRRMVCEIFSKYAKILECRKYTDGQTGGYSYKLNVLCITNRLGVEMLVGLD